MTIQEGIALKEAGQKQVESHSPDWIEQMRLRAWQIWAIDGVVSTDELHSYCETIGNPGHHNAWGTVFRKGKGDGGKWKPVDFKRSTRTSARGSIIRTWTYVMPHGDNDE